MTQDETLVLLGGLEPSAPMAWARVETASGAVRERGVDDAPSAPPARTILIIPGADVRVKRLELEARTEAQARVGAPFLFEGEVAAQEPTHYATGAAQDEAGHRLVVAIAEARFTQWLARCRALGGNPHTVLVDATVPHVAAGEALILDTPERTIVAGGALGGFSIEPDLAPTLFARWAAQAHVAAITIHTARRAEWERGVTGARFADSVDVLETLARDAVHPREDAPNLRQGAFAVAAQSTQKPWRMWRFAAFLALVAVMLQVGALVFAGIRDQSAARETMALAERDFRAARPDVQRIVNLRAQVAALVNAMEQSGRQPVLAITDPLIQTLQAHPMARVDELRHDGPTRAVRVRFSAPQAQVLEQVAATLRAQGLTVEARASEPLGLRYSVELVLESPP